MTKYDTRTDIERRFNTLNWESTHQVPRIYGKFTLSPMDHQEQLQTMLWLHDLIRPWPEWSAFMRKTEIGHELYIFRKESAGDLQAMLDGELPLCP